MMSAAAPNTNAEEVRNPGVQSTHIKLRVKGQDGNEMFFKIKRHIQLKRLMNVYCDQQSEDINSVVFVFDGRRIGAEQTAQELEMEDGDTIDVMMHQFG